MAFTPDENDIDLNELQSLEFNKEKFIEDVFNNEYILVIGSEVILDNKVEVSGDINKYLLKTINQLQHTKYTDFNDIILHSNEEIDPIRILLNSDKFKCAMSINDISTELRNLLSLKLFKVVISTTFDGYLELLMRNIWGDRLRVVNICNDKSIADFRNNLKSYRNGMKYDEPTLIYAFGKAEKDEGKMFARTDADFIHIIEKWMQFDKGSDNMLGFIQNKRLLALGCKFDDWYFRFFWYILKREITRLKEGEVAITLDSNDRSESNLGKFLHRTRVYNHKNARAFMNEIINDLSSTDPNSPFREQILRQRSKGGIFISYCNKDVVMAGQLFFMLRKHFDNVWFDNMKLQGGNNYNHEIENAIGDAKVFIPILSPSIANDLINDNTNNYYNKEWRMASQRKGFLTIIPLAINGYNLRDDYHSSSFEKIIGDNISGIDLMQPDGFSRLINAINDILIYNK